MGKKCCVPKCKFRNDPSVSCFQFPSDQDLKSMWLRMIPRNDTFDTTHLGVCIVHFDIKYVKTMTEKGMPLKRSRLTSDAVPTLFDMDDGVEIDLEPDEETISSSADNDFILDFVTFKNELYAHITASDWLTILQENSVSVLKLKRPCNGNTKIEYCVDIDSDLHVKIFRENVLLENSFYKDITRRGDRLILFSELNSILQKCDNCSDSDDENIKRHLKCALQSVSDAKRIIANHPDFEFANCVNIIEDQLLQLTQNRRRYSINTILCAFTIYIQSSKTYELLRDWNVLILPSVSTLKKLSRFQDVDPNNTSSNLNYLKKIISNLTDVEKFVIIEIDEIYSNPQVNFWNQLSGFAENKDEVATTVLGVLVSSCYGKMKEIVNLIPLKDASGQDLKRYVINVIESLQSIGLIVQALITDNNRVNQNLFSLLDPTGTYGFPNPNHLRKVIRLVFDTIHILKNFRNNWINKKDEDKSFFYPNFDNFSVIQQATFKDLRDVYFSEHLKIIKTAPKLNSRTLNPSRFDRQRVPLVLNLIHSTTIAALQIQGYTDTAEFLQVLQTWFSIVNNRTPEIGISRQDFSDHQNNQGNFQIAFLKKFVDWLYAWKEIERNLHVGGLTKDTFEASICSTEGLIRLIFDSFLSTTIETFLCGMFQTDDLEKRFGRYRGLSGYNYNVSVRQIMESEKKLRIRTLISKFPDEFKSSNYALKKDDTVDLTPFIDLVDSDYIENFDDFDYGSFMYVCGYGGHKVSQKLTCQLCRDLIIKSVGDTSDLEYFESLQDGTHVIPTENCVVLLLHMNAIFNELRKDEMQRRMFQVSQNPSQILVLLTLHGVSRNDSFVVNWDDSCPCGTTYKNLFTPVLRMYANIILNNYRKKINDMNVLSKVNKAKEKKMKRKSDKENDNQNSAPKYRKPNNRKASIYEKL